MRSRTFRLLMFSLATATILSISGCSSDGGDSTTTTTTGTTSTSGGATKGPFKKGSLVVAYRLNSDGSRDINQTTLTTDDKGAFSFSSLNWSGPTEFVISGEYFNENSGTTMKLESSQGLSAVVDVTAGSVEKVNINVFTDIAAKSTIAAMAQGSDITSAKSNAEQSVKKLFNLDLASNVSLEELNPLDATQNTQANTQLLVISSALLKTSNPQQVMQQIAEDMTDGEVDDTAVAAMQEVKTEAAAVDLREVSANLESNLGVTTAPDDIESALSGTLALDHNIVFTPVYDAYRSTPYTSNEVSVDGIYGGSGAISIQNGEFSIDGAPFSATATTISNGQKLRIRTTSSANYSSDTITLVTIGGAQIEFRVRTKDDPFVPDTTPAPFSFTPLFNQPKGIDVNASMTVSGINTQTTLSITGGQYSLDGTNWSDADTSVNNGDTVIVRHTTSSSGGTQTKTTLTIGGVSAAFSSYTVADDVTVDAFGFDDAADVETNTTVTSNTVILSGFNVPLTVSVQGGEYSIDGSSVWNTTDGNVTSGQSIQVRTTSADSYATAKEVTLSIGDFVTTFKVTTKPDPVVPDGEPNEFKLNYLVDQNLSTDVTSDPVKVSGINIAVTATVTNATFDINGTGSYTEANVTNGDIITVHQTTAGTFNTDKVSTLTVGGVSADFKTTTIIEDAIIDPISFDRNESVNVGDTNVISNTVTISGINTQVPISVTNGEYSLDGGSTWVSVNGTVQNADTLTLRQPTVASTPETPKTTTVTIGNVTASFTTVTLPAVPVITGSATTTAQEDALYSYTPTLDTTNGGSADSWSITNKPAWADFNTITGELYGIPTNDDVGTFSNITITASNAQGDANITFDITVLNTNDAPTATDINATTQEDNLLSIDVSGAVNDVDQNDILTLSITTQPSNGSASISGTTITYTPSANFFGNDTIVYTITDASGSSASANIYISVTPVNDPATIIGAATLSAVEDLQMSVSTTLVVDDNDSGEAGLQELNATATTLGSVSAQTNGVVTYSVTDSPTIQALAEGEVLNDTNVTLVSLDGTASHTLVLAVTGTNDAPVITTATTDYQVKKDTDLNITVTASDVDNNAVVTLTAASASPSATVTYDASGAITFNAPAAGEYVLSYTFSDEHNATAQGTLAISVRNSDAPIAVDDSASLDEDTNATIDVLANDSDDGPGITAVTLSITQPPLHGSALVQSDKTVLYTPDPDFNGNDSFSYTITDEDNGTATADVNITVNPVNDAPIAGDANLSVSEDTNLTINILEYASDIDNDSLSLTAVSTPINGTVSFSATEIVYTPNSNYNGSDTIIYTVSDGTLDANGTINITVTAQNDAPIITGLNDITIDEDTNASLDINITDPDPGAVLSIQAFSSDTDTATVSISDSGNGTYTLLITPLSDKNGAIEVTVSANDGTVETNATMIVTITPINDAPIAVDDTFNAASNTTVTLDILANDDDVDGDALSIQSCSTPDQNGTVTIDSNNTLLSYTSDANLTNGTETFTCTITDGIATADETITVNVSTNNPPVADNAIFSMIIGETLSGQIPAYDPDGDSLSFTALSVSPELNATLASDGSYTLTALSAGTASIDIAISDGTATTNITYTIDIVYSNEITDPLELSEGPAITSAEFDSLASTAHDTFPVDTKLYSAWGMEYNGDTNTTTFRNDYIEALSDGVFIISDDNQTDFSHNQDYSGTLQVSLGTSFDSNALVAEAIMIDANMSAADIANELPYLTTISLPSNAVVYKLAVRMTQDEYYTEGVAEMWINGSPVTYADLDSMVTQQGAIAFNRYNFNRILVFDANESAADGNGTVIEVDMTGVYNGTSSEPVVINPNAGTWSYLPSAFEDDGGTFIDIIRVDIDPSMEDAYGSNIIPILIQSGAYIDGVTTSEVYRGDYQPAGSTFIEYRFNEALNAVLNNIATPLTVDTWLSEVQDANGTDINSTDFDNLGAGIVDIRTLGALYELEIDHPDYLQPAQFNMYEYLFDYPNSGDFTVNVTVNGIPDTNATEQLSYSIDTNNVVTLSKADSNGNSIDVYKVKIISIIDAQGIYSGLGLTVPTGGYVYELAGLQLVDEAYYDAQEVAYAYDSNDSQVGPFSTITSFIESAQLQYQTAFMDRYDTNGTRYVLAFEDGSSGSSSGDLGNLVELNLDTGATASAGTWEIVTLPLSGEDTLLIHPSIPDYERYGDICYGFDGGSTLLRGDIDYAGNGEINYLANDVSAEYLMLNFQNQFPLPFSYQELANNTYYGVYEDGSQQLVIRYSDLYDHHRDIEFGTFIFNTPINQAYVIEGGKILILNSDGSLSTTIERIEHNDLYSIVNVNDGTNSFNVRIFKEMILAEEYFNSLQ